MRPNENIGLNEKIYYPIFRLRHLACRNDREGFEGFVYLQIEGRKNVRFKKLIFLIIFSSICVYSRDEKKTLPSLVEINSFLHDR